MDDTPRNNKTFVFEPFTVDLWSRRLICKGDEIRLARRPFDILINLIDNRERVVSRSELLDEFWDGHDVYDDALRKCIGAIRTALNDKGKPARFIETRYGGGYRFVADVEVISKNGNGSNSFAAMDHFAANGNKRSVQKTPAPSQTSRLRPVALFAAISLLILTLGFYVFVPRQQTSASQIEATQPPPQIRSIAVMPIKNLTGEEKNEYFSDGITESVITQLARIDELKVISLSSTVTLKNKEIDPREIGKQLDVDVLLEGSVQKRGDLVNVRVRLVSTRDGSIIWTSSDLERSLTDSYDLQDAIACNVAAELRAKLCGETSNYKTDGLAYQEYLKGRFEWNKRTGEGIKQSIEHYRKAIQIDPQYALAYSGLTESYLQGIWHVPFDPNDVLPKARETALQAVKLNEGLAEAHTALAGVYSLEWNWAESYREMQRAIQLNPRFARTHHILAFHYMLHGRHDEALAAIDVAASLDPLNLVISTDKGNLLLAAGRTAEAFRQWERTISLDPNFVMAHEHRAAAFELLGEEAAAIQENATIMKLKGNSPSKIDAFRQTGKKFGLKEVRRRELGDLLVKEKRGEVVSPVVLAYYYALLGQKDVAFAWLEKGFSERNAQLVLLVSPEFASLADDPRHAELVKRIGLRQ